MSAVQLYQAGWIMMALSVVLSCYLGIIYHGTRHLGARTVDLAVNIVHCSVHGLSLLWYGYVPAFCMLAVIVVGYFKVARVSNAPWVHVLVVHVPLIAGWSYLASITTPSSGL